MAVQPAISHIQNAVAKTKLIGKHATSTWTCFSSFKIKPQRYIAGNVRNLNTYYNPVNFQGANHVHLPKPDSCRERNIISPNSTALQESYIIFTSQFAALNLDFPSTRSIFARYTEELLYWPK
ncbi:hypothetical protein CIHG_03779 [Coccidioides immitis H538.4]|uniref:Uncharacterized protein n=3 Tax=Coccidioides immitis TaxID=5501 RepID=A0A0J8R0E8_COCIT|nr:hypothetical protein CIRG_04960 [Coccidioides immitis RMSCC 2394]KMU77810.1 hypothetical protein CISG_01567 [Coccidioides immitis RMSCC 3703]KMU85738.1 hypothetical protein CIHG_03779 [Coccidioides immitis H538.4]